MMLRYWSRLWRDFTCAIVPFNPNTKYMHVHNVVDSLYSSIIYR